VHSGITQTLGESLNVPLLTPYPFIYVISPWFRHHTWPLNLSFCLSARLALLDLVTSAESLRAFCRASDYVPSKNYQLNSFHSNHRSWIESTDYSSYRAPEHIKIDGLLSASDVDSGTYGIEIPFLGKLRNFIFQKKEGKQAPNRLLLRIRPIPTSLSAFFFVKRPMWGRRGARQSVFVLLKQGSELPDRSSTLRAAHVELA